MGNDVSPLVRDRQLFDLTCAVVKSGLEFVSKQKERKAYIGTYSDLPEMGHFDNGMPSFSKTLNGLPDYKKVFDAYSASMFSGFENRPEFEVEIHPSFQAIKEHFRATPELWKRMLSAVGKEQEDAFFNIEVKLFVTYQIDRYVHVCGTTDFSVSQLLPIYLPLEAAHLLDTLPVDIWIPVLFLKFEQDEITLDSGVHIRRIPEDMQLARAERKSNGLAVNELVLGAATHAFVLDGFQISNSNYGEWSNIASTATAYPTDKVDLLFAMLRLATGADTGYAQLLLDPLGWTSHYEASLRPLTGTSTRRYPAIFENFYWNRDELPIVDSEKAELVKDLYRRVSLIKSEYIRNRVLLATQRLNYCLLRENEEDAILDATSAMEVLLTPGENAEITHKLATRLAALSLLGQEGGTPSKVFKNIKKVYGHRSNVIHGNVAKLQKSNTIQISDGEAIPSTRVATDYLRFALKILIRNPQYLEPSKIDEELLLGSGALRKEL